MQFMWLRMESKPDESNYEGSCAAAMRPFAKVLWIVAFSCSRNTARRHAAADVNQSCLDFSGILSLSRDAVVTPTGGC